VFLLLIHSFNSLYSSRPFFTYGRTVEERRRRATIPNVIVNIGQVAKITKLPFKIRRD